MAKVFLSLGSNLGNKRQNLESAVKLINERIGEISSLSSFYNTAPWGFDSDNSFLNAAACVYTDLTPDDILSETQKIEKEIGRIKKSVDGTYSDRIIDIDILTYDNMQINSPHLTIPHPLMTQRDFVMIPLAEIAPDEIHPISGETFLRIKKNLVSNT